MSGHYTGDLRFVYEQVKLFRLLTLFLLKALLNKYYGDVGRLFIGFKKSLKRSHLI